MDKSIAEQAEQIFFEASNLKPDEREDYVATACAGNNALQQEVMRLLDGAARSSRYFAALPQRLGIAELLDGMVESAVLVGKRGQQFGPYTLTNHVGSGGMGAVWRAVRSDGQFEGDVAIKLLAQKSGGTALQRFNLEGRYLAKLAHANIARLMDAGVAEDGQPYLVLEYVDGIPIDRYCDEQSLDIEHRIGLFLFVLEAVAHAHAHLIVHRDVKPSNVLITADGTVKLLDFGVAKLLSDEQTSGAYLLTQEIGAALTPEFAAPEQLAGGSITTATDVYSLGLLLWLLITGKSPRNTATIKSLSDLRAIAATEPSSMFAAVTGEADLERVKQAARRRSAAPSEFLRALRTDLDSVVRKALAVDPDERYATAVAFASDLQHYLRNEPVTAQSPTMAYRTRKFVRRHRGGVLTAVLMLIALVSAAVITTLQSVEANRQRDIAINQQQRADVEMRLARKSERIANAHATLADFIASDLGSSRSTTEVESQIERAAALVRSNYADDALIRAHLLASLAGRYRRSGDFGRWRALAAEAEVSARDANDVELIAQLTCQRARDVAQSGRVEQARNDVLEQITALDSLQPAPAATLVLCLADASAIARLRGDAHGAIAAAERIRDIEKEAGIEDSINHADTLMILARAYAMAGRYREAVATAEAGLAIHSRVGSDRTPSANNIRSVQASLLRDGGQPLGALKILDALLQDHGARGGSDATMAIIGYEQAMSLLQAGRATEALPALMNSVAAASQRDDRGLQRAASIALGQALAAAGQPEAARAAITNAADLYVDLRKDQSYLARLFLLAEAEVELALHDHDSARVALDETERILQLTGSDVDPTWRRLLTLRARAALATGRPAAALEYAQTGFQHARSQAVDPQASLHVGETLLLSAQARDEAGDTSGAAVDAEAALRHLLATADPSHPGISIARSLARQ